MKYFIITFTILFFSCNTASNYDTLKNRSIENAKIRPCNSNIVDVAPELVDSYNSLNNKIQIPQKFYDSGILKLIVKVRVAVDEMGLPIKSVIDDSVGYGCDEEAIRIISTARFKPAYQCGKPTKMWVTVPIIFKN